MMVCDGGSTDYLTIAHKDKYNLTGPITLLWRGQMWATRYHSFGHKHSGNGANNNPFDFRTDNLATYPVCVRAGTNHNQAYTFASLSLSQNVTHTICVKAAGGDITSGGHAMRCWIDNASNNQTVNPTAPSGPVTGNTQPIYIGRRGDGGTVSLDGAFSLFVGWAHDFTDSQIENRLLPDPWCFLEPAL